MAAQLRPTRQDVTDRYPMLGFTIRTDSPPRVAEVAIATDPALFTKPDARNPSNFFASREQGRLTLEKGEAVYVLPPEVLARFVAADKLYFALATAPPGKEDWTVDLLPTEASPYVSLKGLTDRALRRVRMFPSRRGSRRGYGGPAPAPTFEWAGDRTQPGMTPAGTQAPATAPANGGPAQSPPPANVAYDDGFGPLPPLAPHTPAEASAPPATAPAPGNGASPSAPTAQALAPRPRALTAAEYPGVTRIMPSPAYTDGRNGQAIDRIVIHITDAGQTPYIGSWFTREEADTSAHYMVDQNGDIIQFVREQDAAWHATSANNRSIGIEHVAVKQGGATYGTTHYPHTPPTDAEYRASATLVAHLCRKYGLTPDRTTIIGHSEVDPPRRSFCPDGAWDWDAYMALVAAAHAALGAIGAIGGAIGGVVGTVRDALGLARGLQAEVDPEAMGIEGPAYAETGASPAVAAALALTAKDYDRTARIAPSPAFTAGRSGQTIDRIVIHITDAPTTTSTVSHFTRADANSSAHYLVGQDGEIVQFVNEADTAWHARGANRRSVGIEHVAVKQGGATYGSTTFPYMPPTDTQYCESAALVSYLCQKYGLTPDRATIIGHREADTGTSHTSCPDGAWNWDHFMDLVSNQYCASQPAAQAQSWSGASARALDAGGQSVEIKYRAFIPSPLILGPNSGYDLGPIASGEDFSGDNRGFSYDQGTSRAEITATLTLGADGAISDLRTVHREWGASKAYDSTYTYHVDGKPDWWMDRHAGLEPSRQAKLDASDDNLRIYRGASGTTRNILAMTSNSAVVSVEMAGALPLVSPSPDIDADVAIYLKPGPTGVQAMVVGDHDGFPCHELYINGRAIYTYDPVAAGKSPTSLFPPTDQKFSTDWIDLPARAGATSQALGSARARALAGAGDRLVFRDRPASEDWRTVDFPHVTLTQVSWASAPDEPVAFVFFGHPNIDFDGSPTAYHPDDTGDDHLANAGDAQGGWYGVVALSPNDPAVTSGNAQIDQRPERDLKGKYPVIQRAENGDPFPGYYVSQTSRAADSSLPLYKQARYIDASRIPYGALSGKLKGLGAALGDYGLTIRHDQNLQSGFFLADSGGNTYALGEGSQKVGTNLGGSGRGNRFNNNFPVSFLIFPKTSTTQRSDPPPSESEIAAQVTAIMSQLCTADNARELALLLGYNEVNPGNRPAGKAALDAYLANPAGTALPRNYATIVAGLANFGFVVREDQAQAQSWGQSYRARAASRGLAADDWSINWDEVYPVAQPTDMSCWATAAAMIVGWRDRQSVSPELLAQYNGLAGSIGTGLAPSDKRAFADALGLVVHPNACYTQDGFRDILEANGPIWVTAKVPGVHAIVVTGMYKENGQYYVRITDPWDRVVGSPGAPGSYAATHNTGSQYIMSYDAFTAEFEAAGDIDRIQLLHTGGAHGHFANRGSAAAAGYAQALSGGKEAFGSGAPDNRFGVGTSLTRGHSEKNGVRYDLPQLTGFLMPTNALAGGAGMMPMAGQRVLLNDWPYIDGPSGRTTAGGVDINFQVQNGGVGNVSVVGIDGQMFDGWTATIHVDIAPGQVTADRAQLILRVTTTFSSPGREDQVGVSQVVLNGDGRAQTEHGATSQAAPVPSAAPPGAAPPAAAPLPPADGMAPADRTLAPVS